MVVYVHNGNESQNQARVVTAEPRAVEPAEQDAGEPERTESGSTGEEDRLIDEVAQEPEPASVEGKGGSNSEPPKGQKEEKPEFVWVRDSSEYDTKKFKEFIKSIRENEAYKWLVYNYGRIMKDDRVLAITQKLDGFKLILEKSLDTTIEWEWFYAMIVLTAVAVVYVIMKVCPYWLRAGMGIFMFMQNHQIVAITLVTTALIRLGDSPELRRGSSRMLQLSAVIAVIGVASMFTQIVPNNIGLGTIAVGGALMSVSSMVKASEHSLMATTSSIVAGLGIMAAAIVIYVMPYILEARHIGLCGRVADQTEVYRECIESSKLIAANQMRAEVQQLLKGQERSGYDFSALNIPSDLNTWTMWATLMVGVAIHMYPRMISRLGPTMIAKACGDRQMQRAAGPDRVEANTTVGVTGRDIVEALLSFNHVLLFAPFVVASEATKVVNGVVAICVGAGVSLAMTYMISQGFHRIGESQNDTLHQANRDGTMRVGRAHREFLAEKALTFEIAAVACAGVAAGFTIYPSYLTLAMGLGLAWLYMTQLTWRKHITTALIAVGTGGLSNVGGFGLAILCGWVNSFNQQSAAILRDNNVSYETDIQRE